MGWTTGVRFPGLGGQGTFLFTTASTWALEPTQPLIPWVLGALFQGIRRPEREADHSPPPSATTLT